MMENHIKSNRYPNKPGFVDVEINLLYILLYSSSETIAM